MAWRTATLTVALFLHALQEADRRADIIKTFAKLILEESFVAEVQALGLIGKNDKCGRRRGGLRDVVNFHFSRRWGSSAVEIDFGEPAVQFAGGDAPGARVGDAVDHIEKFFRTIARERGYEHNRRLIVEFAKVDHELFRIVWQIRGVNFPCERVF